MYEPADALASPRFTGARTFGRLPLVTGDLAGADVAVFGMPWDGGTSFRGGARFGPEAIRSASALLRPYHAGLGVQVFGNLSCVDHGDAPTVPGYITETLPRIEAFVAAIAAAGVLPIGMGGDHSVTLAELRALAARHGRLALVQLDSHSDLWDAYFGLPYNHGTVFKRALEEGLVDPHRFVQGGLRGSLYGPADTTVGTDIGVDALPWADLRRLSPEEFGARVRARIGDAPTFITFDVDFVDPAFCPGTGTPEVGGPSSAEALDYLRALTGLNLVGMDVVEVAPQYDGPGQVTALLAANVIHDMLALVARGRA